MGSSAWETKASVIIGLVLGTSCRKPYGHGSKLKTWGTIDSSLFLVLTCIHHPISGVPTFDPYNYMEVSQKGATPKNHPFL